MSVLKITDAGGLRTLALNRPERRNALTSELMESLIVAVREAEGAGARAIVLCGEGEGFCSGLDIDALRESTTKSSEANRIDAERIGRLFKTFWDCDLPTVAAVHGAAVAGGTGLAMVCDFTLATPDAKFGFTEARIGFVPALVSGYLALQVGDKTARDLLLTARIFAAEEAHRLGLVNAIVPREELRARAEALALELLRNSLESLRATKRLLRAQHSDWLNAALAHGMEANAAARETADFREGINAFLEKRKPLWR